MWTKLTILILAFGWVSSASNYVVTWEDPDLAVPVYAPRPLLGEKMCTRGPAYWCHNITQAKECHAVKHCIKKVWEHTKLPEDNDNVCQVCKEMVKEARDQLLSNETQDEIRQVFEGSCNLIPIKLVAKECCDLADQFIPELVDTLASRMDPQVVCAVSGLCNSVRIDEMLGEMKVITPTKQKFDLTADSCPKCNHFMGQAVAYLKNLNKMDLKNRILDICGDLGSYSDSCRAMVIQEFKVIYNHIHNKLSALELCGLNGLCQVSSLHRITLENSITPARLWTPPQPVNDDLPCDFCKQLVAYERNWLIANTTKEEFQEIIEGLCKQAGKYRNECLNLAKQYGKPLYQLLVDELDPVNVCTRIGVCNDSLLKNRYTVIDGSAPISTILSVHTISNSVSDKPMVKLVPGEKLTGDDELNPQKSSAACEFCEYALHSLQNYLGTPATEEEIKDAVDKLCDNILPQELASQCQDFVNDYGDSLIVLLAQQIDPSQICPKLRICTSNQMVVIPLKINTGESQTTDLPTCPLCHMAVAKLIDIIGKNITKEAIDTAMDDVCYALPQSVRTRCLDFMKNYGERIAEMIIIEGTSQEICAVLHLCILGEAELAEGFSGNTPTPSNGVHGSIDSQKGCIMCEFVLTRLDTMLQNNATEEEIKETVEKICDYLPKSVRDPCQAFIDEYGEMIITYLAQSLDPAQVCTQLGLCNSTEVRTLAPDTLTAVQDLNMDNCQLCVVIADYLSTMFNDPKVEESIDKVIERICPILPKKYYAECETMIEDYGPYLMSILAQETDRGRACSLVNICPVPPSN